jgi:hypothetical protein
MKRQPVESPLHRRGTEILFERALLFCQDRGLDQNSLLKFVVKWIDAKTTLPRLKAQLENGS